MTKHYQNNTLGVQAAKGPRPRSSCPRAASRPRTADARGRAAVASSNRIEQLARPRSIERYTERQRDAEEEQLKECTFAPQIRNRRSASARRAPHRRDLSVPGALQSSPNSSPFLSVVRYETRTSIPHAIPHVYLMKRNSLVNNFCLLLQLERGCIMLTIM
jgi:hypothetical protein